MFKMYQLCNKNYTVSVCILEHATPSDICYLISFSDDQEELVTFLCYFGKARRYGSKAPATVRDDRKDCVEQINKKKLY